MSAPDHRRQGGRGARARGGRRGRGRATPPAPAAPPGWPRCSSATTPPARSTSAASSKACAGGRASRGFDHRLPADAPPRGGRRADRRAQRRPGASAASSCQLPGARPPRRRRAHRPRSTRQGRRRPDADLAPGCSRSGAPGLRPVHAGGLHAAARRRRGVDARGRRGGRRRALEPLRQADGPAPARRERHRDRLPLAHARPRRGLPRAPTCSIAAVGRAEMVRADWVKPGAVVIDVGMNRTDDGLVGDVDFAEVARGRAARSRRCPAASGR